MQAAASQFGFLEVIRLFLQSARRSQSKIGIRSCINSDSVLELMQA